MHGFWHISAIATCMSIISVMTGNIGFFILGVVWLNILRLFKRLNILPFIVSLAASIFFLYYIPTENDILTPQISDGTSINLHGKVSAPAELTKNRLQFKIKDSTSKENYLIVYFRASDSHYSHMKTSSIKYGATCHVKGEVMPAQRARNPGQFDYAKYLKEQGIKAQIKVASLKQIDCQGFSIFHLVFQLRQTLLDVIDEISGEHKKAWIQALVLGERRQLQEDIIDLFQRWGLSHILAISGLHVGMIVGSLYILFLRTNLMTKEATEWFLLLFLPFYALLAGGAPSVLRATFMLFIIFFMRRMNLPFSLQDTISIVFLTLIIVNPYMVHQIGFQFSFLVSFSLILSREWLQHIHSPVWQLLIISYISQMAILPLQLHYFHTFQPLSILINFLIVPYYSFFVIPLMFLLLPLVIVIPPVAELLLHLFGIIQLFVETILQLIDQYLYIPFILGEFPIYGVVIYYIVLVLSIKHIEQQKLKQAFQYSMVLVFLLIALILKPYFSNEGKITMLDIGQGDAFVIELPYRKGVFFIDAGAHMTYSREEISSQVYEQVIKPFLYARGIWHVDAIIISHAHVDHYGSVSQIIEDFNTPLLITSDYFEWDHINKNLLNKDHVHVQTVKAGESFTLKGQTFEVLSPLRDELDVDDNSLVFQTNFGPTSWLFTGDISAKMEQKILITNTDDTIDVLKVAHHGSRTSTTLSFIKQYKPQYALISVGKNNTYNHPHQEVIDTLQSEHVKILRTDEHGAVQYIFTEEEGTFFTYLP